MFYKKTKFLSGPKIKPYQRLKDHPGHPINILVNAHKTNRSSEPGREDLLQSLSERKN